MTPRPHAFVLATRQAVKDAPQRVQRYRHGAVLLHRGKVIAAAYNRPGDHAEAALMRKIQRWADRDKLSVVVVRANRSGGLLPSKPCRNCWRALLRNGIRQRNVHWSE